MAWPGEGAREAEVSLGDMSSFSTQAWPGCRQQGREAAGGRACRAREWPAASVPRGLSGGDVGALARAVWGSVGAAVWFLAECSWEGSGVL